MARHTGAVCRLCRREGMKLFLKGARCLSAKCAMERRAYPPGAHGRTRQFRRQESDYGVQLREKQRARRTYGVFEKQFRRYFGLAERMHGKTGENLLSVLERRLDNVVYRLGMADSRAQARQLVNHGHFEVNGRKLGIPSALVEAGDVVRVRDTRRHNGYFGSLGEILEHQSVPQWLSLNHADMSGTVLSLPTREQIDVPFDEMTIVEYYSR